MTSIMNEFDFIRSIKQSTYRNAATIKGIGDDAAVFRQSYHDIVTAVDTFVDGVHFSKQTMDPFQIGYRALVANLSDMAAMGANPIAYLVSIVVPPHYSDQDLAEIYRGLDTIAQKYQLDLIGGDTVTGEQLVLSVTINGAVERDKVRYRHLMKPDDLIFVTGTLGDSAAGLELLLSEQSDIKGANYLIDRHRKPTPRINFAKRLAPIDRIALNDISDGIASELNELAQASHLTIYSNTAKLPVSEPLKQFSRDRQLEYILNGGEDFELVGSVARKDWPIVKQIAKQTETPIVIIGEVIDQETTNGTVWIKNNKVYDKLHSSGYVHRN